MAAQGFSIVATKSARNGPALLSGPRHGLKSLINAARASELPSLRMKTYCGSRATATPERGPGGDIR